MPTCPDGHPSDNSDHCDVCDASPRPRTADRRSPPHPRSRARGGPCPDCGTSRTGRFCEECGHDFISHPGERRPPGAHGSPARWRVAIAADPAYYQFMADQGLLDPDLVAFPAHKPQRRMVLTGGRVRIGRRSASRGVTPEIDLGGPHGDPAVSHIHAVLLPRSDGSWALIDPGSTNGTTVNGTTDPIPPNVEVPLHDSDRIYVGAWTVITVQKW